MRRRKKITRAVLVAAMLAVFAVPVIAYGHIERASYWPDPAPDCSVTPCTGGAVPKARTLASALNAKLPGSTRVVCKPDSLNSISLRISKRPLTRCGLP